MSQPSTRCAIVALQMPDSQACRALSRNITAMWPSASCSVVNVATPLQSECATSHCWPHGPGTSGALDSNAEPCESRWLISHVSSGKALAKNSPWYDANGDTGGRSQVAWLAAPSSAGKSESLTAIETTFKRGNWSEPHMAPIHCSRFIDIAGDHQNRCVREIFDASKLIQANT